MKQKDSIRKIVIIEIIVFLFIIIFVWSEEIFDLPHLIFNAEPTPVNYQESIMETIVFTAIFGFLVYHTMRLLIKIRRLESYVRICARCHKIFVDGRWIPLEEYFNIYAHKETSHGLCDYCKKSIKRD